MTRNVSAQVIWGNVSKISVYNPGNSQKCKIFSVFCHYSHFHMCIIYISCMLYAWCLHEGAVFLWSRTYAQKKKIRLNTKCSKEARVVIGATHAWAARWCSQKHEHFTFFFFHRRAPGDWREVSDEEMGAQRPSRADPDLFPSVALSWL